MDRVDPQEFVFRISVRYLVENFPQFSMVNEVNKPPPPRPPHPAPPFSPVIFEPIANNCN